MEVNKTNADLGRNGGTQNTFSAKQGGSPQQKTCISCKKSFEPSDGKETKKEFICKACQRKNRNKIIAFIIVLILVAGGVVAIIFGTTNNKNRISSANGFEGVGEVTDSVNVNVDSVAVDFNIATATITSVPVSTQAPIDNIQDFKAVVSRNIDSSRTAKTNTVQIPTASILFAFDSSALSNEADNLIKEIASIYNSTNKQTQISIKGYACNLGADAPNNWISEERAKNVKKAFISNGVDESNINIEWFGKTKNSEFDLPNNASYRRVIISMQ